MASTYSDLKFELIGTGEQSGVWGTTTNDNIGTAIEQALVGLGNPIFTTDANLTISLTNTVALQTARALVLNATSSGSLTATRELVVPTIEKQYIVQNNTTGGQSITVKTTAGTGITVPNGKKMHLYVDGTNVVDAVSHFSSLTLASALPVLSGGTGVTTSTGTGNNVLSTSPTLVTPALGTPASGVVTNLTGTASININGTVGATTATTGAFTTLGASSTATLNTLVSSGATLTGGTINGMTVGATTASTGAFTSLTDSGNLAFTGTGNRITGDFSNATAANRVAFQTSTVNSNTVLTVIPNGTSDNPSLLLENSSSPANNGFAQLTIDTASTSLRSGIRGTGTYVPMTFYTGGSERVRIDTSGNVGIGTSSLAGYRVSVKQSGNTSLASIGIASINSANDTYIGMGYNATSDTCRIVASYDTGGAFKPITFLTTDIERARIDTSGNLLVGTTSPSGVARLTINGGSIVASAPTSASTGTYQLADNGISPNTLRVYNNTDSNNTANRFVICDAAASVVRAEIRSNGGLANFSANNVNLSDRREKANFAPAKSYLDTICAIPVQTFNYIDQNMEEDGGLTLGVVAQDVQAVAPELVMESNWGSKDEPKMRLSIYQTDLQYALMKALQELKAEFDAYKLTHP